ncbi:hypothetical protein CLIB1423_01S11430 [[Candida] railenensis]|uniref:Uncharacterized protein n=1 Tax=[Candida] railenensis TaxID=45579 RepID=A0A9P0QKT8_9ASCO|nr:hypothetical protein CLIB1423_01S11430 [[Candida] railenensis]
MLSQLQIRQHPYRIRMIRLYTSNSHSFQASITRRTLDKHHQSVYHLLNKQRTKYNSKKSTVYPTLDHLLICIKKLQEGRLDHVQLVKKFHIHDKKRLNNFIEPLIFHSILSLYFISTSTFPNSIIDIQDGHLSSIMEQAGVQGSPSSESLSEVASHFDFEVLPHNERAIANLMASVNLIETIFPNYTLSKDIIPWMKTIASPNVTESCNSLTSLLHIPPCVLTDIVLRTPMNKEEYYLQLQIWIDFQAQIAIAYHNHSKHLKSGLTSLIYYGIEHDSNKLPELLASTFQYYNGSDRQFGYKHTNFLTKSFLNKLIWDISYNNLRNSHNKVPSTEANITKSQEHILKQLSLMFPGEKPLANLELKGYMGIILAIHKLSSEKAQKLMELAEQKFDPISSNLSSSDSIAYHFTKISLSKSPDRLLYHFNTAADSFSHSSLVWLSFIIKLEESGLLNESRSLKVIKQLVSKQEKILITKDIMLRLLKPLNTLAAIEQLIQALEASEIETLTIAHKSSILPKYLRLLYRSISDESPPEFIPRKLLLSTFRTIYSRVEYCRQVYESVEYKTSSLVGIFLSGECNIQPENLYEVYEKELGQNNLLPNEECLVALLNASCTTNSEGECIMWGQMYAPQLAVHEFRKQVMSKSFQDGELNDSTKIYPTDHLWLRYIYVLSKYGYVAELSAIMEWWVSIEFIPRSGTLLELLLALPPEFGERHIRHMESVSSSNARLLGEAGESHRTSINEWPWPSRDKLAEARRDKVT